MKVVDISLDALAGADFGAFPIAANVFDVQQPMQSLRPERSHARSGFRAGNSRPQRRRPFLMRGSSIGTELPYEDQ